MAVVVKEPGCYAPTGGGTVGSSQGARAQAAAAADPRRTAGVKNTDWMKVLLLAAVVVGVGACREYPTKSIYHSPTISSITVFPSVIGQGDSVSVTVFATDPDGDPLVFDWFTDARLNIKGDVFGNHYLYGTADNSHVFYRSTCTPYDDSAWVSCEVRDGRGGGDGGHVLILLRD
jgi:hypothetical protein